MTRYGLVTRFGEFETILAGLTAHVGLGASRDWGEWNEGGFAKVYVWWGYREGPPSLEDGPFGR